MKSKEEILMRHTNADEWTSGFKSDIESAMDEYAEQITAEKDRTISDLRRQLSDCKAKVRIGVNTDRT